MSDFKRELRYFIFKTKHLTQEKHEQLLGIADSINPPPLECVVVESDWPNYEDTWKAVEQVANGEYQSPYDLIEQQQRDIELLRQSNAKLCGELSVTERERDELAVTVERLRETGTKLRDDIDLSKIVGAGKRNFANEWDAAVSATPHQNLNAIKREAYEQGFLDGFNGGLEIDKKNFIEAFDSPGAIDLGEQQKRHLAKLHGYRYTNQRYTSDKDGES